MLKIKSPSRKSTESNPVKDAGEVTSRVNALLDTGKYADAYPLLERLTTLQNQSTSLHVTAGLVALQLERTSDAVSHFQEALGIDPDHFDAGYNLALVQMMNGEWDEALSCLLHLRRLQPQNASLLNDIAVIWTEKGNLGRALASYARAMKADADNSNTRNNAMDLCLQNDLIRHGLKLLKRQQESQSTGPTTHAEINRWVQILEDASERQGDDSLSDIESICQISDPITDHMRIACFASQATFIKDVMDDFATNSEVRYFKGETVDQMRELMEWADIAWFEWCDSFLIEATKLSKTCKIICRLHSYEAFTDMPSQVDWSKVDHLVFVNQSVQEIFRQQVKVEIPTSVIYNGVNLNRYCIPRDQQPSKKIASVGYINYKKNPALLLYCFKKIHEYDSEYSLHIAGTYQDSRIQLYIDHFLKQNPLPVCFEGWVEDMPAWYADKGYVISTSLFESFHYSIAEGMASGLMPLIHNWYGADYLYPREYLFSDPDDCMRLLRQLESGDQTAKREINRKYITERFNQDDKHAELLGLMNKLAREEAHTLVKG